MAGFATEASRSMGIGSRRIPEAYCGAASVAGGGNVNRGRDRRLRRLRSSRGQALVEMVILLPVFLLLVFGMIEFGRVFNYWIDLTHLANEGARYASVNRWPGCPSNYDVDACSPDSTLQPYLVARANTGELSSSIDDPGAVKICYPLGTANVGDPVRVIVRADIKLPILDGLINLLGGSNVLGMSASSTQRLEWIPDRFDDAAEGMVSPCP
jgi:hypothetical protein